MAYEPIAATSSQAADTFSPRASARIAHAAAPTIATAVQMITDLVLSLRATGAPCLLKVRLLSYSSGQPAKADPQTEVLGKISGEVRHAEPAPEVDDDVARGEVREREVVHVHGPRWVRGDRPVVPAVFDRSQRGAA